MSKLFVSTPFRLWCAQHDRAPESWDKWPRLMPLRVAESHPDDADMMGFESDGRWVINVKAMSCGDNGWLCHDSWLVTEVSGSVVA